MSNGVDLSLVGWNDNETEADLEAQEQERIARYQADWAERDATMFAIYDQDIAAGRITEDAARAEWEQSWVSFFPNARTWRWTDSYTGPRSPYPYGASDSPAPHIVRGPLTGWTDSDLLNYDNKIAGSHSTPEWYAARRELRRRALNEVARLGLQPHPIMQLLDRVSVLVDFARGEEAGAALAETWQFRFTRANSMWHEFDQRRDGNALITLMADDRGWPDDNQYFVIITWASEAAITELGYLPMSAQ